MTPADPSLAGKRANLPAGCALGLFLLFAAQILIGLLLELRYSPTAASAYKDVHAMQASSMAIIRGFHYWGSSLLIAGSFGVLVWMLFAHQFAENARVWIGTLLLFLASLMSQITGNLLPFDRHGVQTAVVEAGVARQTPLAGSFISGRILNGEQFTEGTLAHWHILHVGLLVLGLIAGWLIWSGAKDERKSKALLWAPIGVTLLLAFVAAAPLGHAATPDDYGRFDAQVSWYTWPLHGALNLFARISPNLGWIGAMLIPGLFVALLVVAPWAGKRMSPKALQGAFLAFCAFFVVAAIFFGGTFAPLTGNRDPVTQEATNIPVMGQLDPALITRGQKAFAEQGCADCHGENGLHPTQGPNLKGVAARRGGDPAWYIRFIHDPSSIKPNSMMPPFPKISNDDAKAIAEFLISQK